MTLRNLLRSATVEGSGGSAPAPAPAPASTPAPAAAPDNSAIEREIQQYMDWDPFQPTSEPAAAPAADPAPPPIAPQVQSPDPAVPPTAAPITPQAPPQPDPAAAMAEAAAALRQTAEALPSMIQQQVPQQPAQPAEDYYRPMMDGQPLDYGQMLGQIPEPIFAAIGSENPAERKQGIVAAMATTAHVAHRLAFKQMMGMLQAFANRGVPEIVSRHIEQQSRDQQTFNDFYQAFPQLSHPAIRPVVYEQARVLAQQLGAKGWTPEFRDRLGAHVLGLLRQQVAPAAAAPSAAPMGQPLTPPAVRPTLPGGPSGADDFGFDMLRM